MLYISQDFYIQRFSRFEASISLDVEFAPLDICCILNNIRNFNTFLCIFVGSEFCRWILWEIHENKTTTEIQLIQNCIYNNFSPIKISKTYAYVMKSAGFDSGLWAIKFYSPVNYLFYPWHKIWTRKLKCWRLLCELMKINVKWIVSMLIVWIASSKSYNLSEDFHSIKFGIQIVCFYK